MIQSPETVNIHVYTLSSEKATHCILGTLPNLISHHVFDDVISVSWAVIGSRVALVGVTAGPAGFRAVVLQSATFFSIICNKQTGNASSEPPRMTTFKPHKDPAVNIYCPDLLNRHHF